ncbi:MAG: 50S ribosomal protein L11 methyltransferase [Prevotella sp.]|nr:50S ribosomal protein L11 methyltransferase [Prevotella sp.]
MKYYEVKFSIQAPEELFESVCDVVSALAGETGFETFEQHDNGLTGYIQRQLFDEALLESALAALPFPDATVSYQVEEAEDRDWNEVWEQEGFEPIVVDDSIVVHDGRHLPADLNPSAISIEIDARMAFGTGTHATTRMMIAALRSLPLDGKRLLDCGTGTGILAIAALRLGAREAVGYDIDEWSVDNARHNAVINRVDDRFVSLLGDVTILNKVEGVFDVIVANINRNILLADMPAIVRKLAPQGTLLLSGFYESDVPMLTEKAESLGLKLSAKKVDEEWCCLSLRNCRT